MIKKSFENLEVPALGFGTWQLRGKACQKAIHHALDIGYRHIDTAQLYENEQDVGQALAESDIPREEVFLTTKVGQNRLSCEEVLHSVNESLEKLQTQYCDLLLIHWPSETVPLVNTLEAMKVLKADGKINAIGVSNFPPALLKKAMNIANVMCNQVEYHPFLNQDELLEIASENNLMITAYSPLAKGEVMEDPTLRKIGEKYDKNPVQITLRWLIQQENVVAIPKAADPEHRERNFNIFDFELSSTEMDQIFKLEKGERLIHRPVH